MSHRASQTPADSFSYFPSRQPANQPSTVLFICPSRIRADQNVLLLVCGETFLREVFVDILLCPPLRWCCSLLSSTRGPRIDSRRMLRLSPTVSTSSLAIACPFYSRTIASIRSIDLVRSPFSASWPTSLVLASWPSPSSSMSSPSLPSSTSTSSAQSSLACDSLLFQEHLLRINHQQIG